MQIKVKLKGGGSAAVLPELGPADFVAFERQFNISAAAFEKADDARFEWLCFLAYRGLVALEVVQASDSFDDVLDRIETLEVGDDSEDEAADPDLDPPVPAAPLT